MLDRPRRPCRRQAMRIVVALARLRDAQGAAGGSAHWTMSPHGQRTRLRRTARRAGRAGPDSTTLNVGSWTSYIQPGRVVEVRRDESPQADGRLRRPRRAPDVDPVPRYRSDTDRVSVNTSRGRNRMRLCSATPSWVLAPIATATPRRQCAITGLVPDSGLTLSGNRRATL